MLALHWLIIDINQNIKYKRLCDLEIRKNVVVLSCLISVDNHNETDNAIRNANRSPVQSENKEMSLKLCSCCKFENLEFEENVSYCLLQIYISPLLTKMQFFNLSSIFKR